MITKNITIITCGLWVFVWIFLHGFLKDTWRCSVCGSQVLRNPLESSGFCKICNKEVKITRKKVNHWGHFFMTWITAGLWIPVWIYKSSIAMKEWNCVKCGSKVENTIQH